MASIVTKMGDKGNTSLLLGGKVAKDSPRIELAGALDELCSFLGVSRSLLKHPKTKTNLKKIQKDLFVIGAEVSTKPHFLKRLKHRMDQDHVDWIEKWIQQLENKNCFKRSSFCLPGENFIASTLDVSRTIARRAERQAVYLSKRKQLRNRFILIYLNRLSDLLYLLARYCERGARGK